MLEPTPNVQPNLLAAQNGQTSVPTLLVPRPIGTDVLPINRIALDRLKHDAFLLSVTLHKPTPLVALRPPHPREMRSTPRTRITQPHHEAADASLVSRHGTPVIVVSIMAVRAVALRPQFLDKDKRTPALER